MTPSSSTPPRAVQPDLFVEPVPMVPPPPATPPRLPRDLILASAGSGKTFRISSAIIALLARGERPEEILASTFTRKAAGEILDRVLLRLARASLDESEAALLTVHAGPPSHDGTAFNAAFWNSVLERLVHDLHRVNIGTLDAFFLRTALSFTHELGLPAIWTISDEATGDHIRSLALQDVLARTEQPVLLDLVRSIAQKEATRPIHSALLRKVRHISAVFYALDPLVDDHWSAFDALAALRPADVDAQAEALARQFEGIVLPRTQAGVARTHWSNSIETIKAALRSCDWEAFTDITLVQRARDAEPSLFDRVEIPDDVRELVDQVWRLARTDVAYRMSQRAHALGKFAALYAAALERRRSAAGVYEFDDVTRFLGGVHPIGERDDMYYRLDARARHILLDEFQDTSVPQWEALEPLADELMSGYEDERAAVIVADQKQSIYGWRGGSPDLVTHLRAKYQLRDEQLTTSYRSSAVVLDFVNDLYAQFAEPATWLNDEKFARVAREWVRAFAPHAPAKDLPGHIIVRTGPEDDEPGDKRPRLVRYAAERVAELHRAAPGRSIGVLTRTNGTVARMMMNLRNLDVHASEEGGNPLTDAAPVTAVMALLRLCDHPASVVARYHIAHTPIGSVVGLTDHADAAAAAAVAYRYRSQLIESGYGQTIARIAEGLISSCDDREKRRLAQLVELAFRFEDAATLRPSDFVRYVQRERVEDPVAADVRVMTIHQSKGLEFDIVVLPELDAHFVQSRFTEVMPFRPTPGARVTRAFPYVRAGLAELFAPTDMPELRAAADQAFEGELRDGLSTMYVAITRARHAVHVIIKPGSSKAKTGARVMREALFPDASVEPEQQLLERGDPHWFRDIPAQTTTRVSQPDEPQLALRITDVRSRALTRRSPSELEGGGRTDLSMILRLSGSVATRRGSIAHLWLEQIEWLDAPRAGGTRRAGADGKARVADRAALAALARQVDPDVGDDDVAALYDRYVQWTSNAAVVRLLSADTWPPDSTVHAEVPFLIREGNTLIEGFIDRLVLSRTGDQVTAAAVIDFKTDAIEAGDRRTLQARTDHYRPQIEAYRRAVASMYGLDPAAVQGYLVFLEPAAVVSL